VNELIIKRVEDLIKAEKEKPTPPTQSIQPLIDTSNNKRKISEEEEEEEEKMNKKKQKY
jgi:hypothetical protein